MKNVMLFPALCGFALSAIAGSASLIAQQTPKQAGPDGLQVDNLKTPLGIDDPAPRFSWQLDDPARGAKQTAYDVVVASNTERLQSGKADVWDSGRVESNRSIDIPYG
jgi:alpha-L-rhamnosidase